MNMYFSGEYGPKSFYTFYREILVVVLEERN